MTILSVQDEFSANQTITTTTVSTNTIDNLNRGNLIDLDNLDLLVMITTTFAGGTSLQVNCIESANADLSSPAVISSGEVIPVASLTAGTRVGPARFPLSRNPLRYIGLQYVVVGTMSSGKVNAGFTPDVQTNRSR